MKYLFNLRNLIYLASAILAVSILATDMAVANVLINEMLPSPASDWNGNGDVSGMDDNALSDFRLRRLGFIFQSFNLLSRQTATFNVELPLRYAGMVQGRRARAEEALSAVGLADRMTHRPTELSGGQQQRVAIARAIVNDPAIIMADEPTGNLDSKVGREIMGLLLNLNKERGTMLIIVTHDPTVAQQTQRVIRLRDGLVEDGG